MSTSPITKTTGVVYKNGSGNQVIVTIVNDDLTDPRTYRIEIRNWNNCTPQELIKGVSICGGSFTVQSVGTATTITLNPGERAIIAADLVGVVFYDVVVSVSNQEDVTVFAGTVFETFPAVNNAMSFQQGNTLFWEDWQVIERD